MALTTPFSLCEKTSYVSFVHAIFSFFRVDDAVASRTNQNLQRQNQFFGESNRQSDSRIDICVMVCEIARFFMSFIKTDNSFRR